MPDDGICCDHLRNSLNQVNSTRGGLHEVGLTSLTTGATRMAGIALRRPDKASIYINFCPFCGHKMRG